MIITAAFLMLFLLGFMGFAFDFGHLFVVKTELQTAMDSCALAAAQELDQTASAITRGKNAGRTAANLNRVNMQSPTWAGQGNVVDAEITFRDGAWAATISGTAARYAQCQHTQPAITMWLVKAMGAFYGPASGFAATQTVAASAVATRASAQSTCPIPVAVKKRAGSTAPNYGLTVGEWVTVLGSKTPGSGEFGWYNLDGSNSASETRDELAEGGSCGTRVGDVLGTPGTQTTVDTVWNQRFGIYKNNDGPDVSHPDFTGYSYTPTNWKNASPQNAYSGTPAAGSDASAANYLTKRTAFASFDNTGSDLKHGSGIVFGNANAMNSFKSVATPGTGGQHALYGYSRRLVVVPVLDDASKVVDYLCMFMLHPLTGPKDDGRLEFRGNAGSGSAPCTTNGLAGGTAGPLVPVLVR